MSSFIKNYRSPLILIFSILAGGLIGAVFGEKAMVLEPFGQIFLNLIFTLIVPLVFFSIASSIANMGGMKRLGKILGNTVIVFAFTAILSGILGMLGVMIFNPTKGLEQESIEAILSMANEEVVETQELSVVQQLVKMVTVTDFNGLFTKGNMLQIIIISVLFGLATTMSGDKGTPVKEFLSSASAVMMKMIAIVMYYAPIGLGCYFATVVGQLGAQILEGYLRAFLLYTGISVIYYFGFFTFYAFIASGRLGVKVFWKNAIAPTVTALATCSSAASIPMNLTYTKKIGVPKDIADTVIPLGANTHKDGSVIGGVLKIVFLFGIFGKDYNNLPMLASVLAVSLLVGAVMGAIPGGGMIGEMLILSIYGFPPTALPVIAVISTIIDAPATVLNSTGNTVCAMVVTKLTDGKKWLTEEKEEVKEIA